MCNYCSDIKLVENFNTPNDYEKTILYITELIENNSLILIEGNCEIGKHKNERGCWVHDVIFHKLKCSICNQMYSCYVNTYKGFGTFERLG